MRRPITIASMAAAAIISLSACAPSTSTSLPSAMGQVAVVMPASAAYRQDGGSAVKSGQTYTATQTDQSAVYVSGGGVLELSGTTISSSGETSSSDSSSFYGLNAAVLAGAGSAITLADSTVSSSGAGANGVFASGDGAQVALANVTISATGQYAHAVMATNGGALTLTNVDMRTAGANAGAIATDRGSGTISVTGGNVTTSGADSPGIYSTGQISVADATITATGSEAAVIEGANTISLTNTTLTGAQKWGVMIYQSMSGDAEGTQGTFTMTGGTLSAVVGPLFYVTNSTGVITLSGVSLINPSGALIDASAGAWGGSGSNGGQAILTADAQLMTGDIGADAVSTAAVTLKNGSALTGAINAANTAQAASLTLDAWSTWTVTADSYLTTLSDADGIVSGTVSNIIGNGHTVYYDVAANPALGGATYTLSGGGLLTPAS
ncbi:hypothetical protein K2Z83_01070 [Oscillochloris sp. ZM17-4]|uniref:hypothetical protein n=1 Tax=Oscillochloris sp. ZM17-4 TaxID=2866714 RepID=UPI001C73E0C6|nr:hypothetical protein [Oscillochloris sp. ZM17-4]MBX0326285.1 hypothetical protein [Oscillochloris sp. ZM17-4]